jgi:hypothetical protein
MAVRCSKCGEELLGPVNRCWKCGQTFATLPDAAGLPPVRRETTQVPAAAPPARAAGEGTAAAAAPVLPLEPVQTAGNPAAVAAADAPGAIRTGSPFAPGAVMAPVAPSQTVGHGATLTTRNRPKAPPTSDLIRDQVAVAGAIAAIVLGAFGLSVSWMTNPTAIIGGALIAILGLVMGMWGLHSRRRGWALFGMLVCVAAIALASYSGAMLLYEARLEEREAEGQIVEP